MKWDPVDWKGSPPSVAAAELPADLPLAWPDRSSTAVLPFENTSGDPEQEYFADGMTEDILTTLSRFQNLFVITRNSSFTYIGRVVDIKQFGLELGVPQAAETIPSSAFVRLRCPGFRAGCGPTGLEQSIEAALDEM